VDDEPLVLQEFANNPLFAENGYQVIGFSTLPFSACKEIKKLCPDAVFADLKMPECSGVDLMETLRKKGVECEFVIVSAYPEFEESRRFFRLGGFDYLLKPVSDHDLQTLLNRLYGKIAANKMSEPLEDTPSAELNRIVAYMKEHLSEKLTLERLSKEHHVARNSVCRLFATHLNTTFVAYLTKLRMMEAARLLKETPQELAEIAEICGYHNYFYFCRLFKEHYACAPSEYRGGSRVKND
jgi:YesN/AraC family two-component response regulator